MLQDTKNTYQNTRDVIPAMQNPQQRQPSQLQQTPDQSLLRDTGNKEVKVVATGKPLPPPPQESIDDSISLFVSILVFVVIFSGAILALLLRRWFIKKKSSSAEPEDATNQELGEAGAAHTNADIAEETHSMHPQHKKRKKHKKKKRKHKK
jgi:hypothetical protein